MVNVFPFTSIGDNSGMGFGFLTFKKRKQQLVLREKFFLEISALLSLFSEGKPTTMGVDSIKLFTVEELKESTNNYASNMIIGRGAYGIVYKGILPDMRLIAINKSQILDQYQVEQCINEVFVLGQIQHKNVVQLLGCCLETEVPLLVYEFVPNGTLYEHIHNETSGRERLSWDSRLRIALESALALAYLHSDARMPIIHRNVKSDNILLDENYTAKVADFGSSRLLPLDRDEVYTQVVGTVGYLDPEYFHTGQLTDKSDVFSFGVVLAELLTRKKPIHMESYQEERTLASYFVMAMKEDRLPDIVDNLILGEATDEQISRACNLVCRCLNQVRGNRPSMKEVAMELETLRNHDCLSQDNRNQSDTFVESEQFDHDDDVNSNASYASASETFGEQML